MKFPLAALSAIAQFVFVVTCVFGQGHEKGDVVIAGQYFPAVWIGQLRENVVKDLRNPAEYCLEDGYLYKSTRYRVGSMNLYLDPEQDLSHILGRVVVVYGSMDRDLNKILVKMDKAPENYGDEESMMQIRDDWVAPETGFSIGRSTVEKLKAVEFLRCGCLQKYPGFSIKAQQGKLDLVFKNVFAEDLHHVTLFAHYETIFAKPSPRHEYKEVEVLKTGQTASISVPWEIADDGAHFSLVSAGVKLQGRIAADIDYRVSK